MWLAPIFVFFHYFFCIGIKFMFLLNFKNGKGIVEVQENEDEIEIGENKEAEEVEEEGEDLGTWYTIVDSTMLVRSCGIVYTGSFLFA